MNAQTIFVLKTLGFAVALLVLFSSLSHAEETNMTTPKTTTELTPMQKWVTKENGTEPAFSNAYWNHKEDGIYVDINSGEPLFSSKDKFDSGTGWPSFTKPIDKKNINMKTDRSHGMERVEVRSSTGDSHLGHVFNDGPPEKGGTRFCINSASLRFVPKDRLVIEGYAEYLPLFEEK